MIYETYTLKSERQRKKCVAGMGIEPPHHPVRAHHSRPHGRVFGRSAI